MTIKFLDLHEQYLSIKKEVDDAIASVIRDSAFIGGKHVDLFEEKFARYQQAGHCIGVGNGTDALEIAIEALDLPPESEIIVPANSFIASAEAVTRAGHRVVFCDSDPDDYTINVDDARRRVTKKTAAIVPVHLYGHPCDMDPLLDMAREHGLRIIEDCAQAHGAEYKGRRVGTFGDAGAFSFYPGKNLGAYGDGGAILTNSGAIEKKCRMIANHGRIAKYDHQFEGRNSRLDGLQAAILTVKLGHLEEWTEHRIRIADFYVDHLKNVEGLALPLRREWARHVYHLFVVQVSGRDMLRQRLAEAGIETGVHYPIALPKLQAFRYCHQHAEKMVANQQDETLLSLPISGCLSLESVVQVVGQIKK